jgi:hypothetical protein
MTTIRVSQDPHITGLVENTSSAYRLQYRPWHDYPSFELKLPTNEKVIYKTNMVFVFGRDAWTVQKKTASLVKFNKTLA